MFFFDTRFWDKDSWWLWDMAVVVLEQPLGRKVGDALQPALLANKVRRAHRDKARLCLDGDAVDTGAAPVKASKPCMTLGSETPDCMLLLSSNILGIAAIALHC